MKSLSAPILVFLLLLTSCGADKQGLLNDACGKVADANELTVAAFRGEALYKDRDESWRVASEAFDKLASDFPEYLDYSVTVSGVYVAFKETFADVPAESDFQKVGSLCKINLLYLW
jgi:hypothetical protein